MKLIVRALLLLLVLGVPVWAASAESSALKPFRHEIKSGKIEEECRLMDAGAKVAYRFASSAPVAFNVHFHQGKLVEYPIKVDRTGGENGIFIAASKQEFCWMWTNSSNDVVTIEGELAPQP